jgi:hypothetical protein
MSHMKNPAITTLLTTLLFTSCNSPDDSTSTKKTTYHVTIPGRNNTKSLERPDIYQATTPVNWTFTEPSPNESLTDTKKPIYEMTLYGDEDNILITIHNFPSETIEERIPPEAQVARWKQQLGGEKAHNVTITQQSFGGFSGLRFEGQGKIEGKDTMFIGWTMQVSPEHFYALSQEHEELTHGERKQMRSDYTIKIIGPPHLIEQNKEVINNFGRSFRLIKSIPAKR